MPIQQLLELLAPERLSLLNRAIQSWPILFEQEELDQWLETLRIGALRVLRSQLLALIPTTAAPASTPTPAATPGPTVARAPTLATLTTSHPISDNMDVDGDNDETLPTHVPALHADTPPAELIQLRKKALEDLQSHIKNVQEHGIPEGAKIIPVTDAAEILDDLYHSRQAATDPEVRKVLDLIILALEVNFDAVRMRE